MNLQAQRIIRGINWPMILSLAVLLLFSLVFVGSAAYNIKEGTFREYIGKQVIWILVAAACFILTLNIRYRFFHDHAYLLYAGGLLIMFVLLLIPTASTTRSWIRFPDFSFQPSELMKLVYVFAMARFLEDWEKNGGLRRLLVPLVMTGIPAFLIILQPDLGMTIVFVPVLMVMLFMAGARIRHLALLALLGVLTVPAALVGSQMVKAVTGQPLISPYQIDRITAFLDPEKEKLGVSYQAYQSLAAIGSGCLTGRGVGHGIKTQFDQLPAKHTDFIVAVVAEEGGFLAVALLLTAFYLFLFFALLTAHNAPDQFGRLVAIGIIAIISTQILINLSVATSLMPITGITLPFVSYGGSSMMASFIAIGVVMGIGREKKAYFS
ncbi:MAG: FtsW/RodA/SpoVE family cell cycle protein [Planctomycetota bacterium]